MYLYSSSLSEKRTLIVECSNATGFKPHLIPPKDVSTLLCEISERAPEVKYGTQNVSCKNGFVVGYFPSGCNDWTGRKTIILFDARKDEIESIDTDTLQARLQAMAKLLVGDGEENQRTVCAQVKPFAIRIQRSVSKRFYQRFPFWLSVMIVLAIILFVFRAE